MLFAIIQLLASLAERVGAFGLGLVGDLVLLVAAIAVLIWLKRRSMRRTNQLRNVKRPHDLT